tara:strand:+ start:1090 stop:1782 length:693 start_codon:yes stop_codon:yes gene_type:complete
MSSINIKNIKNYILGSYKLFCSIFIICLLILAFFYKTTERVFTAKIDIRDIDWISYNLIFPGFSLDDKYGVVGLYPGEINYSFYTVIQSRVISGKNYDVKFNDSSFGNKGGKLFLYYYQKDNDKKIKENLNEFILNVNQIICQKLFELISYEITKTSKFTNIPNNAPTIEQLTLWKNNIKNNPKIVRWDIELAEIKSNLPYLKSYLIISFLLSLLISIISIVLFPKFKKD